MAETCLLAACYTFVQAPCTQCYREGMDSYSFALASAVREQCLLLVTLACEILRRMQSNKKYY
eukprot:317971-Amphidinium_carterae.1